MCFAVFFFDIVSLYNYVSFLLMKAYIECIYWMQNIGVCVKWSAEMI
jgi:hypothetical protein